MQPRKDEGSCFRQSLMLELTQCHQLHGFVRGLQMVAREVPVFCLRFTSGGKRELLTHYSSKKGSRPHTWGLNWVTRLSLSQSLVKERNALIGQTELMPPSGAWSAPLHGNHVLERGLPQRSFEVLFPKEGGRHWAAHSSSKCRPPRPSYWVCASQTSRWKRVFWSLC